MADMNSLFKGKKAACSLTSEKISLTLLKRLIPVRNLSEEKLQAFALEKSTETLAAGETLFSIDHPAEAAIYLVKGSVTVADKNANSYDVDAESTLARFPLCSGVKHITSAIAKTDISFVRVSNKIMSVDNTINREELVIPPELSQNRLLHLFAQYFVEEKLEIPSLPNVAVKLRKAIQEDKSIADIVKIIQIDPVISAKLIEVANCPLYYASNPAKSCLSAVNRIGLNGTRNLVVSLSLKQIFNTSTSDIKNYLDQIWKQSLKLSCLCFALASESKQQNPEEALLAGLVCDIGAIPVLNFIAKLPAEFHDSAEIVETIHTVKSIVGATVLSNWNFTEEFIDVAHNSNDWYQNNSDELSLTDIVVLSRLHLKISRKETKGLPAITSIPAASKLKNVALSPENTLHLLHDAQGKINDALAAFGR